MREIRAMIKRNVKLFFKDKGMFFTSLITPVILLVLYATFLGNVYRDAFLSSFPEGVSIPDKLINGLVGGELCSSLLAVCCVTVAFCSNMIMVQDRVYGAVKDLTITPVKKSVLALSYYISTFISTLIICLLAVIMEFIYLSKMGWYLSFADVVCLLADVILLVMFGTVLSSIVNVFLRTQGQISAVGTIVSSVYGFICGAYMPISNFADGLQKAISFLPGTYGTSLLRSHAMRGAFAELGNLGFPETVIDEIKNAVDCNIYFFGTQVEDSAKCMILVCTVVVLLAVYVMLNMRANSIRNA
ncbi:MAG: ABC transporter permease [Faecalibacterium sp.]|nr:ABC transporter permease [Ruminococcus sp.]MCM1391368.1 ABC transporter permease [Ruminococcus sp.]MCM1484578.1 ABC transporter permease [Faecalibacterium sp.]